MLFAMHEMLFLSIFIVMLIGIADGIMPSMEFEYVYGLPFARRVGFSRALGIEGFFSNLIGAAAPVVFGVVMMYGSGGLGAIAVLIAVCETLFLMINGMTKKGKKEPAEGKV